MELSTSSTVGAAAVEDRAMVSPSRSSTEVSPPGGWIWTKRSPSGVAERSSAVLAAGNGTSERIRIATRAVKSWAVIDSISPMSAPCRRTFALAGRFSALENTAYTLKDCAPRLGEGSGTRSSPTLQPASITVAAHAATVVAARRKGALVLIAVP